MGQGERWDVFLAYASPDRDRARELYQALMTAEDRRKFRIIFDNVDEFNRAMRFINRERTISETGTQVIGGSPSAERLEGETRRALTAGHAAREDCAIVRLD